MATLQTHTINSLPKLKEAMRQIATHDGRFFTGRTLSSRQERSAIETVATIIKALTTEEHITVYLTPMPKAPKITKQERWNNFCNEAQNATRELREMQEEYEGWRDSLGETGADSTKTLLEEVCNLELESAVETLETASNLTLPQGFGRD